MTCYDVLLVSGTRHKTDKGYHIYGLLTTEKHCGHQRQSTQETDACEVKV